MSDILLRIFTIIEDRKANPKPDSYTNHLLGAGETEILKKVGEEAVEVIVAATTQTNDRLVEELADLAYHSLVLLAARDMSLEDVTAVLESRFDA